ncbi:MAG: septal ring lytic transglycosylase RlpA family protein [Chitinophagaceae bacterium]|nr:septal ring lytic transglycosylase RlpA family protein [Chitinophagaceae bacterium]
MKKGTLFISLLVCISTAVIAQQSKRAKVEKAPAIQRGVASYYADKFQGRRMANGNKYDHQKLTAAANRYPLGVWVKVSNLSNKKSVIVQITDRMHHKNKRLIDLSKSAAKKLGFVKKGLTRVSVEVVDPPDPPEADEEQ